MKLTWWLAGAAMALELAVTFWLAAATPGHNLVHDYLSTIGATGEPYMLGFALAGIVAAALHLPFVLGQRDVLGGKIGVVVAWMFAGFFVLLGLGLLFPCDPGCALQTVPAMTHFILGLLAFASLGLAALLAVVWCARQRIKAPWFVAAGVILVASDIALLFGDLTGRYRGLVERTTIVAMMAWTVSWLDARRAQAM